jgi:hypothetical protein
MTLMAISLALTAGGILLLYLYLLFGTRADRWQDDECSPLEAFAGSWKSAGFASGTLCRRHAGR